MKRQRSFWISTILTRIFIFSSTADRYREIFPPPTIKTLFTLGLYRPSRRKNWSRLEGRPMR